MYTLSGFERQGGSAVLALLHERKRQHEAFTLMHAARVMQRGCGAAAAGVGAEHGMALGHP